MSNLIERLKFNGFNGKENVLHRTRRWTVERADAAARIAELVVDVEHLNQFCIDKDARIAELEAALQDIASIGWVIHAARAALKVNN
jgi:hypothetical protein